MLEYDDAFLSVCIYLKKPSQQVRSNVQN